VNSGTAPFPARTLSICRSFACIAGVMLIFVLSGCAERTMKGTGDPSSYPVGYHERGMASWYGPGFDGHRTANGELFDMRDLTAAHRTLPFGAMVQVRSLYNDRKVNVRINDRGPFARGRILDLSHAAALQLGMIGEGTHDVDLMVIGYRGRPDDGGAFSIQVASFGDRTRAQAFIAKLGSYRDVRLSRVDLAGGIRYRVFVGRFVSEGEAAAMADRLDRQFQVESLIVRDE